MEMTVKTHWIPTKIPLQGKVRAHTLSPLTAESTAIKPESLLKDFILAAFRLLMVAQESSNQIEGDQDTQSP